MQDVDALMIPTSGLMPDSQKACHGLGYMHESVNSCHPDPSEGGHVSEKFGSWEIPQKVYKPCSML